MLSLFRPKEYRSVDKILDNNCFYLKGFERLKVNQIAVSLVGKGLLNHFCQVIRSRKIDYELILKTLLVILRVLQISAPIHENSQIELLLEFIDEKIGKILYGPAERDNNQARTSGDQSAQSLHASVDLSLSIYVTPINHLLGKIVKPLVDLQRRILHCYEMIYRPKIAIDVDLCWATLNLLRRFTDFGKSLQEIARYYGSEYETGMIYVTKTLHNDIIVLYKRAREYLTREISFTYIKVQQLTSEVLASDLKQQIKQLLLLVEEMEHVNQSLRVLYCTKYYARQLVLNEILMPYLFNSDQEIDLFYQLVSFSGKISKKSSQTEKTVRRKTVIELVQDI